jgi:3-oxoacyl-[acyl-carrier protein] reductase
VAGKAALHALSRYLAQELGPQGVTVNVVAPGPVYSPRTRAGLEAGGAERVISGSALGRVGEPEDVAETVAFLVSDAARHMTGATIDVNGGYLMI